MKRYPVHKRYAYHLHGHRIMVQEDCDIFAKLPVVFHFTYREMDRRDFYAMRGRIYARKGAQLVT